MITDAIENEILHVAVSMAVANLAVLFPAFAPILSIPGVKTALEIILRYIVGPVFVNFQRLVNFSIIDAENRIQKEAAQLARDNLQKVLSDEKATEKQIADARDDFRNKYAAIIGMRKGQN